MDLCEKSIYPCACLYAFLFLSAYLSMFCIAVIGSALRCTVMVSRQSDLHDSPASSPDILVFT